MLTILSPRRILVSGLAVICLMLSSSLFAQPLGTSLKISAKRCEKMLN